jgi:ABC-type lipoprotein release transport system permease subunit
VANDPVALGVVFALAGTFITVGLFVYLPCTKAFGRWYLRRTLRRLHQGRRFLAVKRVGYALRLLDAVVVLSCRLGIAFYAAVVLLIVVPTLLTIGSLALAASLVRVP